jgi:hypothetical protein
MATRDGLPRLSVPCASRRIEHNAVLALSRTLRAGAVRRGRSAASDAWLVEARACGVPATETFAAGLDQDGAAVRAALTEPGRGSEALWNSDTVYLPQRDAAAPHIAYLPGSSWDPG